MNLPDCFARPEDATGALPLLLVDRAGLAGWAAGQQEAVRAWLQAAGFDGQPGAPLLVPAAEGGAAFALAGVGDLADPLAVAHLPSQLPPGSYRLDPASPLTPEPGRLLLGWGLGSYRFGRYLGAAAREPARLVLPADAAGSEAASLLAACLRVRDLVNTPTQDMGPEQLEAVALEIARAHGAQARVVRGDELLAENFPAIHAVGRASHRAPRLVELSWGDPGHPRLALVGKGVCFDTGGLDLKAADGMRNMKKDMGGAAHALALAELVMARRLPVRLQLLLPLVENAVGPDAFRPGEVLATRKGLSIEVDNTDAEGRLVLCDALAYAAESRPELLLDFATLTGAARVALGPDLPALYSHDDDLAQAWLAAGDQERDPLWRMPLWRPYITYLRSGVADLANSGASRMAGSITAALFLDRFVPEGQAWAHVDVYAWNDNDRPGRPAGGEAQGLRAAFAMLKARYRA
ncbi:MAG TPA: leucyl aminopeptidase family protein [Arenimonas sp.]|nr:leucyl aminopeptidase family protein [Arenimonas sp.]